MATDILEHIDDDRDALREFRRVLRPGGRAVISEPAYQSLWSEHDEALMHRRRYVARTLGARAREAGFAIERLSYALAFLLPLALARLLRRRPPASRALGAQLVPVPDLLNFARIRFQRLEGWLTEHMDLPFGLSVVAVLKKPIPSRDRQSAGPHRAWNSTPIPTP